MVHENNPDATRCMGEIETTERNATSHHQLLAGQILISWFVLRTQTANCMMLDGVLARSTPSACVRCRALIGAYWHHCCL